MQVNEQLETVAAPSLTPPKSIAGSESPHSHPFGEELKQDQETPNAATFRKDLPVDDGPESPLTKKEVSLASLIRVGCDPLSLLHDRC